MQQARIATAVDRWPRASRSQIGCQVHPDESVTHMDSDLVTWNVILDTCSSPLAAAPGSSASCWLSFWQRATVHFSCVGLWGLQGKLLSCAALGSKGLECLTPGRGFADGWRSEKGSFEISNRFDSKGFLGPSPAWRLPGSCCQCHSLRPKSQPGAARARRGCSKAT